MSYPEVFFSSVVTRKATAAYVWLYDRVVGLSAEWSVPSSYLVVEGFQEER